ncbi:MAG TPA: hypothetical protein ENJ37_05900 [Deltaproteobacteria bacterium]|nr:hypothetical protein [Deltaproteobacteria bacterium]
MRGAALAIAAAVLLLRAPCASASADVMERDAKAGEPVIVERVIRIEGTIEKPRILFIVPRARIWRADFFGKSFLDDMLRPVYPDKLTEEGGAALP